MKSTLMQRVWAIIEPVILLIASALLARLLLRGTGFSGDVADAALFATVGPQWRTAAVAVLVVLLVRWGLLLGASEWLSRKRGYSCTRPVTAAGRWPIGRGALLGLAVGAVLVLPSAITRYVHFEITPLGLVPPVWNLVAQSAWTVDFWLFRAVGSFLLVPVIEELFFRGYALGNLALNFTPRTAILISALTFAAVHMQYLRLDAFALFNAVIVFVAGLILAWLVFKTRSLIPSIVAHGFGNLPRSTVWVVLDIVTALVGLFVLTLLLRRERPAVAAQARLT